LGLYLRLRKIVWKMGKTPKYIRGIPRALKESIIGYKESYRRGVEKFGIWWKIFNISIWCFILIFIFTAVIIFVIYLPKVEMIYWELR